MKLSTSTISIITIAVSLLPLAAGAELEPAQLEFFEKNIRPVLARNCYACHSAEAKTRMGGLSLDTRQGIRDGGQRGHAVVPNDLDSSLVMGVLAYDG